MAISIPIISEFDGKGIAKAKQEFSQLEGAGAKAQHVIKKAAIPAAAALAGVGAALFDATKGAMEDQAAQEKLAGIIDRTTGASNDAKAAVEDWITAQGRATGFADDQLRPALGKLVTATGDVQQAQKDLALAMDIATATGKPLGVVADALAKAHNDQFAALNKLDPKMKDLIKSGADTDTIFKSLSDTFGGAASKNAETAAGKMAILKLSMDETKESIGAALLPIIERLLPLLQGLADWAQNNPEAFTVIGAALAGVATSIMLINAAMALNPFTATVLAIGAVVAAVVLAYKKFETFRSIVRTVVNGIAGYFEFMVNAWIKAINVVIRGINLVKPGKDIGYLSAISIGSIGAEPAKATEGASAGGFRMFDQANNITSASEGVAKSKAASNVNIYVQGGDPQATVDALSTYSRQNGSLPSTIRLAS